MAAPGEAHMGAIYDACRKTALADERMRDLVTRYATPDD